jgi:hypothetical protein
VHWDQYLPRSGVSEVSEVFEVFEVFEVTEVWEVWEVSRPSVILSAAKDLLSWQATMRSFAALRTTEGLER